MKIRRQILQAGGAVITVLLVGASCAKISAPTGGPKDVDPPVILKSQPRNESVMFSEKAFSITFDEYVVLDKITEKFMVSPPLTTKPDIKLKGKELIVSWDEELADSTTYSFYFQDAVSDNNEKNPIPDLHYVFSTGPVLDSLSVSGNVFNGFDLEASNEMLAMLYSNLSDTAPRKLIPAYIAKPDLSGGFVFNNLRPGRYRLFAVKDLNANKRYDLDDEQFGFYDSIIVVTPEDNAAAALDSISYKAPKSPETTKPDIYTFGNFRVHSFTAGQKKQYLKFSERKSAGGLSFGLALPADSSQFSVSIVGVPREDWYMEHNHLRDTFRLWITELEVYAQDLLKACVTYPFTDSTGTITARTDTLIMRHQSAPAGRGGVRQPKKSITTNLSNQVKPGTRGWFSSNTPINKLDSARIFLSQTVDSLTKKIPVSFMKDEADSRRFFMTTALKPGASYSLVCSDSAFTDIYGVSNDSTVYKFNVATSDNYGSVTVHISGYKGDVIVQLLGEKETVVRQSFVRSPGIVLFDLLDKGSYKLKAIYDLDGNREWTTGNYAEKKQPEPVTYYKTALDVKINWELEEDWDIGIRNAKDISLRSKPEVKK